MGGLYTLFRRYESQSYFFILHTILILDFQQDEPFWMDYISMIYRPLWGMLYHGHRRGFRTADDNPDDLNLVILKICSRALRWLAPTCLCALTITFLVL